MKHRANLAGLLVLSVVLTATTPYAGDKMPITTSSEKAMEYYLQGRDLQEKLRFPDSKPYFESAVAEDPNFAMAYLNLAFAQSSTKRFLEVLEQAKTAMVHASEAEQMRIAAAEAGRPDEAMKKFELGVALVEKSDLSEPTKANTRLLFEFNAGRVAVNKGDLATARRHHESLFEAATEKQNRFQIWLAHQLAGQIAMEAQDYKTAIHELEQANQQDMYNIYRMAVASEKLGHHDRARELCTQVTENNQLSNINYVIVRHKAEHMLDAM